MTGLLSSHLFRMPTVDRFMEALIDDIRSGRTVLVLLPDFVEVDLVWDEINGLLEKRQELNIKWGGFSIPDMPRDEDPHLALARACQVVWPDPTTSQTVSNLLDLDEFPDFMLLRDLGSLAEDEQVPWLNMINRWQTAGQSVVNRGGKPKGLVLIGKYKGFRSGISAILDKLLVRWWWGIPSALEMRQLCRLADSYEEDAKLTSVSRWREHVLPGLAGNDVGLAESLWDHAQSSGEDLMEAIGSLADFREWTASDLEAWRANEVESASQKYRLRELASPPFDFRALWASGALSYSSDYGLDLNPIANMILGQEVAVKRKIWRGQVELLSPVLDDLRIEICQYLSSVYGYDWPIRWISPPTADQDRAVRSEPMAAEWGHIVRVLGDYRLKGQERLRYDQAYLARKIRNDIYHYDLAEFRDFHRLNSMMAR